MKTKNKKDTITIITFAITITTTTITIKQTRKRFSRFEEENKKSFKNIFKFYHIKKNEYTPQNILKKTLLHKKKLF